MSKSKTALKKECDAIDSQINDKIDLLNQTVEELAPVGETIRVKRGGVWEVTVCGHPITSANPGEFRAKSQNGKIHWFHYSQIIL